MDQHRGERKGAWPLAGRGFAVSAQGLLFLRGLILQATSRWRREERAGLVSGSLPFLHLPSPSSTLLELLLNFWGSYSLGSINSTSSGDSKG